MVMKAEAISYYHRQYDHDFSHEEESLIKRVVITALPFLSFYRPIGVVLSVVCGSFRAFHEFNKGNKCGYFIGLVSVVAVANCFFKHKLSLVMTTGTDIFENLLQCAHNLSQGQVYEAVVSLMSLINSSAYVGMLLYPGMELLLFSLAMQVIFELMQSHHEFRNGKLIEGYGKLLMASIRGYQAMPYAQFFWAMHSVTIYRFISMQRENLSRICHRITSLLDVPCWWYVDKGSRIFSPIRTDKADQCSTYMGEVIARIFYASLAIPMVPFLLTLTAIGAVPRLAANLLQPHSFFYLAGNKDMEKKTCDDVKVLTMNACFVPACSRLFGGVSLWRERVDALVQKIIASNADVLCLQEMNDVEAAYALQATLKDRYAHFYINVGAQFSSENSGHFIASRYPISDVDFTSFVSGGGTQSMVNKGLFSFALTCGDKLFAHVFAVHLSPSKDDFVATEKEKMERARELNMIMERIEEAERKCANSMKIFLGDMNLRWGSEEWKQSLLSSSAFDDAYNRNRANVDKLSGTCATDDMVRAFYKKEDKGWYRAPMILDYVLAYRNKHMEDIEVTSELVRSFDDMTDPYEAISDHNGILSRFKRGKA
jgi:endonuclease/exonuclease/phosphatase family metal-dependent hydrolase